MNTIGHLVMTSVFVVIITALFHYVLTWKSASITMPSNHFHHVRKYYKHSEYTWIYIRNNIRLIEWYHITDLSHFLKYTLYM